MGQETHTLDEFATGPTDSDDTTSAAPTPHEAVEEFLDDCAVKSTTRPIYRSHLRWFPQYCDEVGIDTVADLTPADIVKYDEARSKWLNDSVDCLGWFTIRTDRRLLRRFCQYLETTIDEVDDLADAVPAPTDAPPHDSP